MDPELPGLASYKELHNLVAEIEGLIEPYDPLDVIGSFSFENLAYTTDNTLLGDGGQAFVEYLVVLCLKKTRSSEKSRSIPPVVIADLCDRRDVHSKHADRPWRDSYPKNECFPHPACDLYPCTLPQTRPS